MIKIIGVGDLILNNIDHDKSSAQLMDSLSQLWDEDGFVIGNLETPLIQEGEPYLSSGYFPSFYAPAAWAETLRNAGFRVLSVANNHAYDQGGRGLKETREALESSGIKCSGYILPGENAQRPVILRHGDVAVGVLSYACGMNRFVEERFGSVAQWGELQVENDIADLKGLVDVVIVSLHMGHEYLPLPSYRAHKRHNLLLDMGADIVFGHHPHRPQGYEFKKAKAAFFSLGNFISPELSRAEIGITLKRVFWGEGNIFSPRGIGRWHTALIALCVASKNGVDSVSTKYYTFDSKCRYRVATVTVLTPGRWKSFFIELVYQGCRLIRHPMKRVRELHKQ